jgi:integrase
MASLLRRYYQRKDPATGQSARTMIPAWYIQYKDSTGRWRRVKGYKDKEATRQLAAKLERKVERHLAGLTDPHDDEQKKPVEEHVKAFAQFLTDKGNCKKYVTCEKGRVQRLLDGCGFCRIADISASAVTAWLAGNRENNGMSIKTSNYYLRSLQAFCDWLMLDKRASENRVAYLEMMNAKTDVRLERRILSPDEFVRLIEATETGEPIKGLSGPSRVMLYLAAANSGLRASELRSLTSASVAIDDRQQGTITVEASYSKRRRRDTQPIRGDVTKLLIDWARGTPADEPLWPGSWSNNAAKIIKTDLAAAREKWLKESTNDQERGEREKSLYLCVGDAAGRVFDFHALRHQYISNLAVAGVHPKLAQVLARHSTITLTMDLYSHVGPADAAAALDELPALPVIATTQLTPLSTTADQTFANQPETSVSLTHPLAQTPDAACPDTSSCVIEDSCPAADEATEEECPNPLQHGTLCTLSHSLANTDIKVEPEGAWLGSNGRWRIANLPVLISKD